MFDEYDLNSHTHDVTSCECYACVLTRYWANVNDVLAPSAQERVESQWAKSQWNVPADLALNDYLLIRTGHRDQALWEVWGDVFDAIAESERIDRIIRYGGN